MIKKIFKIPDMHCSACVMRLESIEDEMVGISRIRASYHKGQMEVEYDENQVSELQITQAIREKGYEVG